MDLGKRLKAKRKEKNISAEYLAKELGISVSTVYRYEDSSILKIPVSTFEKMCDILGTTPAQMMGNVPEKTVDIKSGNDLPVNFDNPKDAMEFLLKLPTVALMADMIRQRWMTRQWWHLQMKFYSSYNL